MEEDLESCKWYLIYQDLSNRLSRYDILFRYYLYKICLLQGPLKPGTDFLYSYNKPFYGLIAIYYDREILQSFRQYLVKHYNMNPADILFDQWSNERFNRYVMPRSVVQHMGLISAGTSAGSMNNSQTFNLPIVRWQKGWKERPY